MFSHYSLRRKARPPSFSVATSFFSLFVNFPKNESKLAAGAHILKGEATGSPAKKCCINTNYSSNAMAGTEEKSPENPTNKTSYHT